MKPIKTRREYHLIMAEIETYLAKGFDNLTPEEDDDLEKLSKKVSEYEIIHFPMPVKHDLTTILEAYMKENNLTKQRLASFLGIGNSTLRAVLNPVRSLPIC